jgi:phospholipase C
VVIASPFTRGDPASPRVVSTTFDHTSVLKLIEWRYGLQPLTARDATARNIGEVLDFGQAPQLDPVVPDYTAPPGAGLGCTVGSSAAFSTDMVAIRDSGLADRLGLRTDYRFEDSYR